MSVRLIVGPAGSGKTAYCLETLRDRERGGRPAIYLVPEQSSYMAERELLEGSDLPGLRHVHVFSFSRFAFWLRDLCGAPDPPAVGEAVRPMLLRLVMARFSDQELGPLAPLRSRQGFLEELSRFVREVRNHGAVDFLQRVQQWAGQAPGQAPGRPIVQPLAQPPPPSARQLSLNLEPLLEPAGPPRKILALARVFESYDSSLRDRGRVDPEQALVGLEALIAARGELFSGVPVLVDGFLSWTRREREILVALAVAGAELEIALCSDPPDADPPRAPFTASRRTLASTEEAMRRAGVLVRSPLELRRSSRMDGFEAELYKSASRREERRAAPVVLQPARDPRQEVWSWARQIDRWIRGPDPTPPARCAVILREVEPYRDLVREIFPRYGIPYFLDERREVLAHPRVRLLLGALEVLLSHWKREAVITFLRNPILGAAPASIDLLENLSLEYGRDFDAWKSPLPWSEYSLPRRSTPLPREEEAEPEAEGKTAPECLGDEEIDSEGDGAPPEDANAWEDGRLAYVDALRRRLLLPLCRMEERWQLSCGDQGIPLTGPEVARTLRALEAELAGAAGHPPGGALPSADGNEEDARWDGRVNQTIDELLDEMALLWVEVPITLEELSRTLRQGLEASRLGVTPLRLEQVMITEVQRSRLPEMDRTIVGGMNEGMFPRVAAEDALLNVWDREELKVLGRRSARPRRSARKRRPISSTWR